MKFQTITSPRNGEKHGTAHRMLLDPKSGPTPSTAWLLTALQLPKIGVAAARRLGLALWNQRGHPDLAALLDVQRQATLRGHDESLAVARAERIIEECAKKDILIISIADEEFPERLREIKDAPPVLYVRGALSSLRMRGCAVVGTRQSSDTGECIAQRIAALLTKLNVVTVSGLALGIDAAAHKGALAVAILAHGLHMISPTTNRKIAEDLVASGGALLAEHEPGVPPRPAEFVRRNRIQSGMSFCSIIVESGAVGEGSRVGRDARTGMNSSSTSHPRSNNLSRPVCPSSVSIQRRRS